MKYFVRRMSLLFLCLTLIFCTFPLVCLADDKSADTITIGLSEYPRYGYYDESGNCAGVDVEYAYRICQNANLNVNIKLIPDAESYFKALDSGDVDLLFDCLKSDDREEKYLFADYESGSTPISVYVRNDDDRFTYGDTEQLKNIVFGSEKDSNVTDVYIKWCESHGFTPKINEYNDSYAVNAALDNGEIDAGVYGTDAVGGYTTILKCCPTPYYCMFRKESLELKNKIDAAMDKIISEDPLYREKLLQKYSNSNDNTMAALTAEEKKYIQDNPVLTVAVLENDAPYYSIDEDGKEKGIFPDYYNQISKLTGLEFRFKLYENQDKAVAAVKSGEANILGMYSSGLLLAHDQDMRLTHPYSNVSFALITKVGTSTDSINTVAVKQRYVNIVRQGIGLKDNVGTYVCNNASECFEALRNGEADAVVCGLPSATWLVNQTYSSAYSVSSISSVSLELSAAVSYSDSTLCGILDKSINASLYTFDGIVTANTLTERNLRTVVSQIPPMWLIGVATVLVLLIIGLVVAIILLIKRQKEKVAFEREKLRLEAAEKSNAAKNRFFSNISHDMRTPLNAVIGFAGLAAKEQVSEKAADYLSKIQLSGELLLDLINDTLTISKINSGKPELHLEPVGSLELFDSFIVPIREAAEKKGIKFTADRTGVKNRVILADKLNTQKIFLNLLSNAVKYTKTGGLVDFRIKYEPPKGEKSKTIFIIKDNGIGISEEFLPHIYEPFRQENEQKSSGTGLGLSIVKQLVELMGGSIEVESEKGIGTSFKVTLYFEEVKDAKTIHALTNETMDSSKLKGKKVLMCEDNELNSEIACALLNSFGLTVDTAKNGREGVQKFMLSKPYTYDAVIMDIRMPVMDGFEASKNIRALTRNDAERVPIIAMTADAFGDDIKLCFEAGMNAHITKPIDPALLKKTLCEYIK